MNNKELILKSLGHIEAIISYTNNIEDCKMFFNNPIALDISLFHISQIGELCKRFTDDFKDKYQNIDYRAVSGLRNIVVHDYSGVNYNEIFTIIKKDIYELKQVYSKILVNDYNMDISEIEKIISSYVNTRKFII